jgi:hypothetical protein
MTEFGLGPNRRRDRPSSSAGTWSNRFHAHQPEPRPRRQGRILGVLGAVVVDVEGGLRRTAAADAPTSELLRTVASEVRSLVQGELTSARREITGKVLGARPVMAKLGAGAVLGAMAAGTSAATLVRALDRVLPRTASALAATALLGGAAAALAAAAREELRRMGSLVPEEAVQSVKADVAAVATPPPPAEASGRGPGLEVVLARKLQQ